MSADLIHAFLAIAVLMLPMCFVRWVIERSCRHRRKSLHDDAGPRFPTHDERPLAHMKRTGHARNDSPRS